jgi:hypothetical protein
MKNQTAGQLKYGGWGVAVGAVVAMLLGFTWGGWVTANTASKMSNEAVLAHRSTICVAQFMEAPDHVAQLKAFGAVESWKRREFVENGGWDKMPGEETARGFVSGSCANGIEALLDN